MVVRVNVRFSIYLTLIVVVTGNTATVGFGLYGYSGLITLLALVLVETEPM